jgi:hypothetical protein
MLNSTHTHDTPRHVLPPDRLHENPWVATRADNGSQILHYKT